LNKEDVSSSIIFSVIEDHNRERAELTKELEKIENSVTQLNQYVKKLTSSLERAHNNPVESTSIVSNVQPQELAPIQDPIIQISNIPQIPILNPNPSIPLDPKQFEYLLGIKGKSSEVIIIPLNSTPDSELKTIKITPECYTDKYGFASFPLDHSRYVNLHDSILVTGGMERGISFENCYLIKILKDNLTNNYTATVINYSPMKQKRERHNIIYLEHLGAVLVCSGFYTKTCEINYLGSNDTEWKALPPMCEFRANATMFCVNKRFVYCVGGFQVLDRDKPLGGVYLNTTEFIDTANFNSGWKSIDLLMFNSSLKLCAMGVINRNPNQILLVGGYDGLKYLTEINELVFDKDGNFMKIVPNGARKELGRGVIFTSNQNFIATPYKKMLNFDSNSRVVSYDPESDEFSVKVLNN
jgi:hypothetical protein